MKKYFLKQKGFTLIEILVASFIFASILGVVYSLLNDTLISKKELELNLTLNQQVKNANEVLQGVMRQASGDFFTDGEFNTNSSQTQDPNFKTAHLFFVANSYVQPNINNAPTDWDMARTGKYLYVKISTDTEKTIYIFSLLDTTKKLTIEKWALNADVWTKVQDKTPLLTYESNVAVFSVTFKTTDSGVKIPLSIYSPNQGEMAPMSISVRLQLNAISQWKQITNVREMDQHYIPLFITNPYL
jgi:prepilin-type N-terminal cleavage/methylation domain-containing protein